MDKFTELKTNFTKLLDDTHEREKSAPVGSFPNEPALLKHLAVITTLEACKNSFKIECEKIENQPESVQNILEPEITDAIIAE